MSHTARTEPEGRGQLSGANPFDDEGLADQLSTVARSLEQQSDVGETLDAIVHAVVRTVPGTKHASICAIRKRRDVETRAASDDRSRAVDRAQYETGQGPCLDILFQQDTVRVTDMTAERRWPAFSARASALGVGSMLCVQLFVEGDLLGALNLHSEDVDAFNDEAEHVALLFASHAAVAMAGAQQKEGLRRAVSTRQTIGQAQGILMERCRLTEDQAFGRLVRASQLSNRKLHEVAADLVRSGELPAAPSGEQLPPS